MKHLAVIQNEFLIQAKQYSRRWMKMNMVEQRQYLEDHPRSKKVVTGKPPNYTKRKKYRMKPKNRKFRKNEKIRHMKDQHTMQTLQGA